MKPSNLKILNIQSNILNIKYSNYLIFKFLKGWLMDKSIQSNRSRLQ